MEKDHLPNFPVNINFFFFFFSYFSFSFLALFLQIQRRLRGRLTPERKDQKEEKHMRGPRLAAVGPLALSPQRSTLDQVPFFGFFCVFSLYFYFLYVFDTFLIFFSGGNSGQAPNKRGRNKAARKSLVSASGN